MKAYLNQLPLIAPPCSFTNCGKDAVCGLQNKTQPDFHVNVCALHYKQLTGKDWDESYFERGKSESIS